jgi:hypothetical protein
LKDAFKKANKKDNNQVLGVSPVHVCKTWAAQLAAEKVSDTEKSFM